MPLPNTRVVPPGWETHHRGVPDGAATATVTVVRPDTTGHWDPNHGPTGGTVYDDPTTVWAGPGRVQALSDRVGNPVVGEQQQTIRRYLVVVPLDCPPVEVGDAVDVTAATDTQTAGLALRVVDVPHGSLVWERDLECEQREP